MEYRIVSDTEFRITQDGDSGTRKLSFYAAVFDSLSEDLGGFREKIGRRAFTKTINENQDVYACFNHNPDNLLGRRSAGTLRLHVDLTGLRAEVDLPDTQLGKDIATWVDRGDLRGASFAFRAMKDHWTKAEDGTPLREVQELRLYDVSPVVMPAYSDTNGSMALRAATANLFDLDILAAPLLKVRAGLPLDAEERDRIKDVITRLNSTVSEPPTDDSDATADETGHSRQAAYRRRQLDLIALMGGR